MAEFLIDLASLPEDDRIAMMGQKAQDGAVIGFVVEDNEKADRYIEKLQKTFRIRVIARGSGPIKNSILVRIGPIPH